MNKFDQNDPLATLLADDTQAVDRNRLAKLLAPYVQFDKETKEISFLSSFNVISNEAKLEIALLASKARLLILGTPEGFSPSELIKMEIMPEGSIKSTIKKLNDARKVKKDTAGRYIIPNYRMDEIINRFSKGD